VAGSRGISDSTDRALSRSHLTRWGCGVCSAGAGRYSAKGAGGGFDLDCLRRGLGGFRHRHAEHAFGDIGLDLVTIGPVRQQERTLEFAIAAFGQVIPFFLLLLCFIFLALDDERVARPRALDILFRHAGQLGAHLEGSLILGDIDRGEGDAECSVWAETGKRQNAESTGETIEQSVRFGTKRPPDFGRAGDRLSGFFTGTGVVAIEITPPRVGGEARADFA
jgi:hypothetical protein